MRRTFAALTAAAALSLGVLAGPATAAPSPNACVGQNAATYAHAFGGVRAASENFFGDGPKAVQTAWNFILTGCGAGGR